MLRIIAGEAKGRILRAPKGQVTRPTAARVREALFNILGRRVVGAVFLDVFAGSGAVGIEALSRGARRVVFIESNRQALRCLQANLEKVGWKDRAEVLRCEARSALPSLIRRGERFDLIFLDPPYQKNLLEEVLLELKPLLRPGGLVVAEIAAREEFTAGIGDFKFLERYIYGDTALVLLNKPEEV